MDITIETRERDTLIPLMILYIVAFAFIGFGYFVVNEVLDRLGEE